MITGSTTISTSTIQLGTSTVPFTTDLIIVAKSTNSGTVYVGGVSGVTTLGTAATDGLELPAGASVTINPGFNKSPAGIYLIASASGQTVTFMYQ